MDTTKENLTNATSLADAGSPATVTDHDNDESGRSEWRSNRWFTRIRGMLAGLILVLSLWWLISGFLPEVRFSASGSSTDFTTVQIRSLPVFLHIIGYYLWGCVVIWFLFWRRKKS